jgi:hypothetical protein
MRTAGKEQDAAVFSVKQQQQQQQQQQHSSSSRQYRPVMPLCRSAGLLRQA